MFSIIIPLFNKERFIRRTLDSVRAQKIKNFEVIIVDDGSTDNGALIVENEYPEFSLIKKKNGGVSSARNLGIKHAKNEYIVFLDADDVLSESYLITLFNILRYDNTIKIIGSSYTQNIKMLEHKVINPNLRIIENYFDNALINTMFLTSATAVRKDFFDTNEGFDSNLTRGEDLDVWFRAVLSGGSVVYIENKMVYYSNEDEYALTKKVYPIKKSIISKLNDNIYEEYAKNNKSFSSFRSKYIYLTLYRYWFFNNKGYDERSIYNSIHNRIAILDMIYNLPTFVMKPILNFNLSKKILRKVILLLL